MWAQYKKTLVPIQALILTVCALLYWARIDPRNIATVFVVMEAGSLYGASIGVRWRRGIVATSETLPLSRRR